MALDPEQIRYYDETLANVDHQLRAMPGPTDEESGRFCHIMLVLVDAARNNYNKLRTAFNQGDQIAMSWACRNLLEVAIFSKYVLISSEKATEFADDRLIDALQIGIALRKLEQDARNTRLALGPAGEQNGPLNSGDPTDADSIIQDYTKQLEDARVSRRKPLRVGDLACIVGLKDEYEAVNKISSKLVHPTAWSLFTAGAGSRRFPGASEIFFMCGALYVSMAYDEFLPHVRKWGLRHRPPES
jgi:hypothetical protein